MVTTYPRPFTGASVTSRRSSTHSNYRHGDGAGYNESDAQDYGNAAQVHQAIAPVDEDRASLSQTTLDDAANANINPMGEEEEQGVGVIHQVMSPRGNSGGSLKQSLSPRDEEGDGASLNQSFNTRFGDGASIHQENTPRNGLGIILHQNMASDDEVSLHQGMSSQEQPAHNQTDGGMNRNMNMDDTLIPSRLPERNSANSKNSARSNRLVNNVVPSNDNEADVDTNTTPASVEKSKVAPVISQPDVVPETRNDKEPRQASLLLVGPKGAGKTTLVYRFLDRDEQPKPTLALDYTYGRKPGRVTMVKDVCHLWEVAGGTQQQLVTTVISSSHLSSLTAIIALDLSRPAHIFEELLTTLTHLKSQVQDAVKKNSLEYPELPNKLQDKAWARVGPDHADRKHIDPLLVPLVIVGGKYDKFQDFDPESKKVVCRALRYIAHTNGAALQFFSSRDAGLIKKSKELMSHFGFGTAEVKSLAQDYNRPLIIPCGSDSLNIIGGAVEGGPTMSVDGWKHAIMAKFPKSESDAGPRTRLPEDPSRDENYREPDIDNLRAQKDQELERLCREAGRLNQRYADLEL